MRGSPVAVVPCTKLLVQDKDMIVVKIGETVINMPVSLFLTQDFDPMNHQNVIQLNLECEIRRSDLLVYRRTGFFLLSYVEDLEGNPVV